VEKPEILANGSKRTNLPKMVNNSTIVVGVNKSSALLWTPTPLAPEEIMAPEEKMSR
jgi:hypothetical protein